MSEEAKTSPSKFLAVLFGAAPDGYRTEVRPVPGTPTWVQTDGTGVPELTPQSDWYFGVAPRGAGGKVDVGTLVWVDVDHPPEGFDPTDLRPRPTAVVRSGRVGGMHAYWALDRPVEAGHATRLARLAALAFGGDPVAAQSAARVQRLPGSLNRKYDPPVPCEAVLLDPNARYEPGQVEELLLVEVLRRFWSGGERHQLALGLGALLTRSEDWDRERIERTVRVLVHRTGDEEGGDRARAAVASLARRESNLPVAVAPLREALGEEYAKLTDALGLASRDGELVFDGVVVGHRVHLERDLTEWVLAQGEWAWADGVPTRWDGTCWRASSAEEMSSWVFRKLSRMKEVVDGEELDMVARGAHARGICSLACGFMAGSPLPPPEPYYLPVLNGVVDLRTGTVAEHAKEFRNRWVCPVEWDPGAGCPMWERFLDEATGDPSEVEFLQEWVGYCLIPGNPWERMVWLFGPSGTGKSTFLGRISNMLGPSCVAVRGENFDSYTLATLASCRVAVCAELASSVLKTTTLKSLVSGDPIQARHAYGRPFTVAFPGKFLFSTNELPPVDQSVGLWRRLVVFPFERVVAEPDVHLKEQLDTELPGILQWAVCGLRRLEKFDQQGQWPLPKSVVEIVSEYREAADTFGQFHHDELIPDPSHLKPPVPARELYARYTWWCKDRSVSPEPYGPVFWREMRNLGLEPQVEEPPDGSGKRRVRLWRGATLVEPEALTQPPDD